MALRSRDPRGSQPNPIQVARRREAYEVLGAALGSGMLWGLAPAVALGSLSTPFLGALAVVMVALAGIVTLVAFANGWRMFGLYQELDVEDRSSLRLLLLGAGLAGVLCPVIPLVELLLLSTLLVG